MRRKWNERPAELFPPDVSQDLLKGEERKELIRLVARLLREAMARHRKEEGHEQDHN